MTRAEIEKLVAERLGWVSVKVDMYGVQAKLPNGTHINSGLMSAKLWNALVDAEERLYWHYHHRVQS